MPAASECFEGVADGRSPLPANKSQFKSENAITTDKHREGFTAGSFAEPAGPHFTRSLSRKAGGVFNSRTENVLGSRLDEYQPYSNDSLGKIPHIEQQSKRFFISKAFSQQNPLPKGEWT